MSGENVNTETIKYLYRIYNIFYIYISSITVKMFNAKTKLFIQNSRALIYHEYKELKAKREFILSGDYRGINLR